MTEAVEDPKETKGIDRAILVEWGRLFRLSNQTPLQDSAIDGIIVVTGDWTDRIHTALELWQKYADLQGIENAPFLIPAGLVSKRGWIVGSEVGKQQYHALWMTKWFKKHGVPSDKILIEPSAKNSKEAADLSLQIARDNGLKNLILTLSPYYIPRAYMIFVASILSQEHPTRIRLYTVPSKDLPWDGFVPDEAKTRFQQIPNEIARIHTYQPRGDVVTETQLQTYVEWLKSQSV